MGLLHPCPPRGWSQLGPRQRQVPPYSGFLAHRRSLDRSATTKEPSLPIIPPNPTPPQSSGYCYNPWSPFRDYESLQQCFTSLYDEQARGHVPRVACLGLALPLQPGLPLEHARSKPLLLPTRGKNKCWSDSCQADCRPDPGFLSTSRRKEGTLIWGSQQDICASIHSPQP